MRAPPAFSTPGSASAGWPPCNPARSLRSTPIASTVTAPACPTRSRFCARRSTACGVPAARLRVEPFEQRLPLLDVPRGTARRDVPQREAMRRELHVVLRVAQIAEHRKSQAVYEAVQLLGRARSRIDTHAEDADAT